MNEPVEGTGDEELGSLWRTALSMRINFLWRMGPREEMERALRSWWEI